MKNAFENGRVTQEARDRENIFLLSGFPRRPDQPGEGPNVLLSIVYTGDESAKSAVISRIGDVLPKCWEGNFLPHYSKVDAEVSALYGFTHIALLEGPDVGIRFEAAIYYAHGAKVETPFILCGYNEPKKEFHHLHCVDCAYGIADWFMRSQGYWKAYYETLDSKQQAKPTPTRH